MANLTFRNSSDELVMDSSVLKAGSVKVVENQYNPGEYSLSIGIKDIDTFHKETSKIRENNDYLVMWLDFEEGTDSFTTEQYKCGSSGASRCI